MPVHREYWKRGSGMGSCWVMTGSVIISINSCNITMVLNRFRTVLRPRRRALVVYLLLDYDLNVVSFAAVFSPLNEPHLAAAARCSAYDGAHCYASACETDACDGSNGRSTRNR